MIYSKKKNDGKWLVIVNPNAGKRKGEKDWDTISHLLTKYDINFLPVFTERPYHAVELSEKYIYKGLKKIIIVGGDGTMNEVVNGIFTQQKHASSEILLGMITVGTGNDWGRMFNIPMKYKEAIKIIKKGETFVQDAVVVKYLHSGVQQRRYFVNIAGIGFDAVVVQKTNRLKERGKNGVLLYLLSIFTTLMNYKHTNTTINIDEKKIQDDVFSICIGIGKYCGGGMMQTPNAIADDGLFDLTVIKKIKRYELIRNIGKLYNGSIIEHPKVETYTGKSIFIDSEPDIHLETDGESLGHSPFRFEIIPKSVRVIVG